MPVDYTSWLPWLYLGISSVFAVCVTVIQVIINNKLTLIHTTVNSNLAAQVQLANEKETQNADLRVQINHLQTVNAQLILAVTPNK